MFVWIAVSGAALLVALGVRDSRAVRRRRVCPVCGSHELAELNSFLWDGHADDGTRVGGSCTIYRCACGEKLIEEHLTDIGPMTTAEHAAWRKAPFPTKPPRARIHRR